MVFVKHIFDQHCAHQLLKLSINAFNQGDYQTAIDHLTVIHDHESSVGRRCSEVVLFYLIESHTALGKIYWQRGSLEDAIEEYHTALGLAPKYADLYFTLAKIYSEYKEPAKSRQALEQALSINPNYTEAKLNLAFLEAQSGNNKKALDMFCGLSQTNSFYDQVLYDKALAASAKSDFHTAFRFFAQAFRVSPDRARSLCAMGQDAHRECRYDEAIKYYHQAKKLQPKYADVYNLLGVSLAQKGLNKQAIVQFQKAVKLAPGFSRAWLNLAYAWDQLGQTIKTKTALAKVMAIDPHNRLANQLAKKMKTASGTKRG
ncbi:MAG: tetratricopeptide repeat protein, partial [bacterium]|nr:tetratricopeptide repeat protein [bacterium]